MAAVETGTWFYGGSPLKADRDEIRFLIGDTQPDRQLLSDQEIRDALSMAFAAGQPGGTLSVPTLTASGSYPAGTRRMTLSASLLEGTVGNGDSFVIDGATQRYYVTTSVTAASNQLTDVEFRPALLEPVTAGTAVVFRLFTLPTAAAICCDHLAARAATKVDVSVDGRSESHAQEFEHWQARAAEFRSQAMASSGHGLSIPVYRV